MDLTKLDELAPQLETMKRNELAQMLKSLQLLLSKAKDCIIAMDKPDNPIPTSVDVSLYHFQHDPGLDSKLVAGVLKHIKTLKYHPNPKNPGSPQICSYGFLMYIFNDQSATVMPLPFIPDHIMDLLLKAVNKLLGTSFNHILINKYKDVNCSLVYHKDDEKCLDRTSPIATFSLGRATRRMLVSLDASKHTPVEEFLLTPGSLFTMMPGFQELYWHAIAAGRKDIDNDAERGVRFSLTFRKLLPGKDKQAPESSSVPVPIPTPTPTTAAVAPATVDDAAATEPNSSVPARPLPADKSNADTFVFGSSLVKGLDEQLLSKHSKNFKVFCNSGACVGDIYEAVERVVKEGNHDITRVSNIFLLCGGNDVENFKKDADIRDLFDDFEDLVWYTREAFPHAKIHIISMIPRRKKYRTHIRNMHNVNNWLKEFCRKEDIRYVDIFSFFLVKTPSIWYLNRKLYNSSDLHFSKIGDSVLGKVLIGVVNLPR